MLFATQDTVHYLETRAASGLDNVDAGAMPTVAPAFVLDRDCYLALRIFADRCAVKLEVLQYELNTGRLLERCECGSNWPVTVCGLIDLFAILTDQDYC
jgi:hypothetical protein